MNQQIKLYYLYCINMHCKVSIFHNMVELQIPLTAKNMVGTYTCPHCNQPLVSAVDVALKNIMSSVNSQNSHQAKVINN